MKFETVLYAAAFLILALISFPKSEDASNQGVDPAALTLAERQEIDAFRRHESDPEAAQENENAGTDPQF